MINATNIISEKFTLNKVDIGEFTSFKVKPMKINTTRYELEGFGGLTLLETCCSLTA